jgi:hypothetical protein
VGLVNSTIERSVSITAGSGSDLVGLVDLVGATNVTVRTGHGALDRIGVDGVQAASITLDGGNSGRGAGRGRSEIGITASTLANNLTIRTGIGDDIVAVGDNPDLAEMLQPWKNSETREGSVHVGNSVNIATDSGDDGVWIRGLNGSANVTINTGSGNDQIGMVESEITGNIRIDTGSSSGFGQGDVGDQVGLIRVKAGNLTVNNSLGHAGFGLAEVTAANVILNGGNSVLSRTANFGKSWIGVTNSDLANLTIWQGHPSDVVVIGVHDALVDSIQIPDPSTNDPIPYAVGLVKVAGTVRVDTNTPGRASHGDVVRISDLEASVLRVNTGLGNDTLIIGERVAINSEFTIRI